VDPLASIAIGIGLFGDSLQTSPSAVLLEVVGLSVMFEGVLTLALSPLVASVRSDSEGDTHILARRWGLARNAGENDPGAAAV
jgi:hypothetical protein